MSNIVFDCDRMRYPFIGLSEFCYRLGLALQRNIIDDELYYYLPASAKDAFGKEVNQIRQRSIHKYISPRFDADLWHTTFQLSKYMPRKKKTKNIFTIHDLNFLYEKRGRHKDEIKHYSRIIQKNIDKSDHIVAISQFVKRDILENLNTQDKSIDVIYNGSDVFCFEDFEDPLYKPKGNFLFSIGTVDPKKNFHVLSGLLQDNDFELIIAGRINPEYQNKIMEVAKSFNVEERVKIIGTISYPDKFWYLKNCYAFMFPSLAEGFGIPVIEAMNFGKPVFLSSLTSLPEIGGQAAYYFENFDIDHMREVFDAGMDDYVENNRLETIKQHASFFSWDRCADEYYKIYRKLLTK